jgi:hypothetical protein
MTGGPTSAGAMSFMQIKNYFHILIDRTNIRRSFVLMVRVLVK